jgi:hypothetical protein
MTEKTLATSPLNALMLCETRGDMRTIRTLLDADAPVVIANGSSAELRVFGELLLRVIKGIDFEAKNGEGTMLDWHHPVTKMMVADGLYSEFAHLNPA